MVKIVINVDYGGFGLSEEAWNRLVELGYTGERYDWKIKRDDSRLVKAVEELSSEKASGAYAKLKIVEIPDGIDWEITEYDGWESVEETHQSWG